MTFLFDVFCFTTFVKISLLIQQYRVEERDFDGYKTEMKLNISLTGDPADFGAYYCISKNEKGITRGAVNVFGK